MSRHVAPYGWTAPHYEHRITDEPDKLDAQTRLLYDHHAGRVGSRSIFHVQGVSGDTTLTHTTVSALLVQEPQVARIASTRYSYVGVRLECRQADTHLTGDAEELTATMMMTASSDLSVLLFPGEDREAEVRPYADFATSDPDLYRVRGEMLERSRATTTVETDAKPLEVRKVLFRIEEIAGWDRHEPLLLGIRVANTISVTSDDVSVDVDFVSEWVVTTVIVDTTKPFQIPKQNPPP